ncbi:hypothetical protein K491DRAFT_175496 [Lophiostoma macrostomum CBS 122681]|uniref:Uncharacterized protein n=1 Tax=Lophiostoma macrostomum CBS 122681 TaxID=1314788 RepID=A0A6A6TT54_9PLEO|nr:hypothetical protein K491DRAFT_175496 [Lophiostoma macrostomum CBS 122681]
MSKHIFPFANFASKPSSHGVWVRNGRSRRCFSGACRRTEVYIPLGLYHYSYCGIRISSQLLGVWIKNLQLGCICMGEGLGHANAVVQLQGVACGGITGLLGRRRTFARKTLATSNYEHLLLMTTTAYSRPRYSPSCTSWCSALGFARQHQ